MNVQNCPNCSQAFRLPDVVPGQTVTCPFCKAEVPAGVAPGGNLPGADAFPEIGVASDPFAVESPAEAGGVPPELMFGSASADAAPLAPPPAPPAADAAAAMGTGRGSRYRDTTSAEATTTADCVIRPFFCEADPMAGTTIAGELLKALSQEACFNSVIISDNAAQFGDKATIDGIATLAEERGGMFKKATGALSVTGSLFVGNSETPLEANAQMQGGNLKAVRKTNVAAVTKQVAKAVVKGVGGYGRLRSEVSNLATAVCVFGILSFIPVFGIICYLATITMAIVAGCYNRKRPDTIGLYRILIGLVGGFIGCMVGIGIVSKW